MHTILRLTAALSACICAYALGAQPAYEWGYNYGGDDFEEFSAATLATDSGFVAVGKTSSSNAGAVDVANSGESDLALLRMSPRGEKVWERQFGGAGRENGFSILRDGLGRYVVGGLSNSERGGTKTVDLESPGPWVTDAYALCVDADGNDVWQWSAGGNGNEEIRSVLLADNGNYLLAGRTSAPADPTTTRALPLKGNSSFWLVELDANGQFVREHLYGGSGNETLYGAIKLRDGTLVLYGTSDSDQSFDKTRGSYGSSDYWLVNVEQDGTVIRDYQFGGTGGENAFFVTEFAGGDLFVSGQSVSGVGGNKNTGALGSLDLWAVRFARATGAIVWERTYGGAGDDNAYTGRRNVNDYILLAGNTRSAIRGDSVDVIDGEDDGWLIYLSPEGELIWDITRGGDERDNIRSMIRSEDGGWYLAGESNSAAFEWRDGDAGGPYGALFNGVRANDGWLAKLECDFEVELFADRVDLCRGEEITLRNERAVYLNHTTFLWSDGTTDSTYTLTPPEDSTVVLQSVSPDACESADSILLDVHASPELLALDVEEESCSGTRDGSLYVAVSDDADDFTVGNAVYTDAQLFDSLSAGSFAIRVNSTLARCGVDTLVELTAAGAFDVDLGEAQEHVIGTTITLDPAPTSDDSLTYVWSGLPGLCASCPRPTFTVSQSGIATVSVTDANGCTETASVQIVGTTDRVVGIPNAITPNNDGVNDRFFVFPTPFVETLGPLRVFDRWGNLLFTGIEGQILQGEGWDGTSNGKVVQSGVYTYILPVRYRDGQERVFQGEINVLR